MAVATAAAKPEEAGEPTRMNWRGQPWGRLLRLWSGLVLLAFVTTHILNHALGVFGVAAMDFGQALRWEIWKSWPGAALLYGAVAVHMALTLRRVIARQTWRMPKDEALQIVSGLAIPLLAASHVVETRIAGSWFGVSEYYQVVLWKLWPDAAIWQTLLLIVAWTHGMVGVHHAFRHRSWYPRLRTAGLLVAVLLPALSLAGFVSAGREVHALNEAPEPQTDAQRAGLDRARMMVRSGLGGVLLVAGGLLAFGFIRRRAASKITVTYRGRGPVLAPRGITLLEVSRLNGIPHPSVCRGRGRCSTCRVHIIAGLDKLPEPHVAERAMLTRIGAPENVRLACQVRPTHDVGVRILMPVLGRKDGAFPDPEIQDWAAERPATVLCLNLRAFNTLTRSRLPYEIAVLLNRFSAEMKQAVENHGGRIDRLHGDALIGVFDVQDDLSAGARNALLAARDMMRVLDLLNMEMSGALPIPIRAGVGVHTGSVVLARIADMAQGSSLMALGLTVSVAAHLEAATKESLADCLISAATAEASRFDFGGLKTRDIEVDGVEGVIHAYAVPDRAALVKLVAGTAVRRAIEAASAGS